MPPGPASLHVPSVDVATLLEASLAPGADRPPVVIDLRTPKEFAEDHLPGALNLPLFKNEERALVGTLYKRESPETAFAAGRELVAERIEALFRAIAEAVDWDLPGVDLPARVLEMTGAGIAGLEGGLVEAPVERLPASSKPAAVFHCWRGGLRSRSVVALLVALGFDRGLCLTGGYRSYRARVMAELEAWQAPPVTVVRGFTGTGKTLVLQAIEALRPGWTVDLEACAGHRSSILGMVGREPVSQKRFESRLAERLRRVGHDRPGGHLVVEGESRKIGDRIQPARVWEALKGGRSVELTASVERRVDVLLADYLELEGSREELRGQLPFIEKRLGPVQWAGRLTGLLDAGEDRELVRLLLEHYYDPLYAHSERDYTYDLAVEMDDPHRTAAEIVAHLEA